MTRSDNRINAYLPVLAFAVLFATVAMLVLAQTASAAIVTGNSYGPYTITASSGETNTITVTQPSSTTVRIVDSSTALTDSSAGCTASGGGLNCNVGSGSTPKSFTWSLNDENDSLSFDSGVTRATNTINAGYGDDTIVGSAKKDTITPGYGADTVDCGSEVDKVTYADHSEGVDVYPDGEAYDGAIGEFDNIAPDCEDLTGGQGANYLIASDLEGGILTGDDEGDLLVASSGNTATNCGGYTWSSALYGNGGNDMLIAKTGYNYLGGGAGDDISFGGEDCDYMYDNGGGSDILDGSSGDDYVHDGYSAGGASDDNIVVGGPGDDSVYGSNGNDLIVAYDQENDTIACGDGTDETIQDEWEEESDNPPYGVCEDVTGIPSRVYN